MLARVRLERCRSWLWPEQAIDCIDSIVECRGKGNHGDQDVKISYQFTDVLGDGRRVLCWRLERDWE